MRNFVAGSETKAAKSLLISVNSAGRRRRRRSIFVQTSENA